MKHPKIDKQTKEKVIQNYLLSVLKEKIPNAYVTKIIESSPNGTPDVLVCHKGRFFAIEVKRPHGGKISALQEQAMQRIEQAGGRAFVVSHPDAVDVVVAIISLGGKDIDDE